MAEGHEAAVAVYKISEKFPAAERFGITLQLRRAALSIPTNIVEGHRRKNAKEFSHYLNIALGSQAEAKYLMEFAVEIGLLGREDANPLLGMLDEVGKLVWALRNSIIK
jgi:four helix bundle protein